MKYKRVAYSDYTSKLQKFRKNVSNKNMPRIAIQHDKTKHRFGGIIHAKYRSKQFTHVIGYAIKNQDQMLIYYLSTEFLTYLLLIDN